MNSENHPFIEHVQRWGNALSLAVFDKNSHIFSVESAQGIIGYRTAQNYVIAFGDPICPPSELEFLAHEFHKHFYAQKKHIIYIGASTQFTQWALSNICTAAIQFGHEIIVDPLQDPLRAQGKKAIILRNQYNQALRADITVHEYIEQDSTIEQEMERVAHQWLKDRKGPQVYFYHVETFNNRTGKRWFYTKQNGHITGLFMLNRIDNYNGWAVNMLMTTSDGHKYTSECLIVGALEILRKEECSFLSIGAHPSHTLGLIHGMGNIYSWIAQKGYALTQKFFNLSNRQRYWQKFNPSLQPSHLLFTKPTIDLKVTYALLRAFNVF